MIIKHASIHGQLYVEDSWVTRKKWFAILNGNGDILDKTLNKKKTFFFTKKRSFKCQKEVYMIYACTNSKLGLYKF